MAEMAAVMQGAGAATADKVQVLFVTHRPGARHAGVAGPVRAGFDQRFIGLRGTPSRRRRRPRNSRCSTRRCRARSRAATRSTTRPAATCSTSEGRLRLFTPPRPADRTTSIGARPAAQHAHPEGTHGTRTARIYARIAAVILLTLGCLYVLQPFLPRSCSRPPSSSPPGPCTCACCARMHGRRTAAALTTDAIAHLARDHPAGARRLQPGRRRRAVFDQLRTAVDSGARCVPPAWLRDVPARRRIG